jgi:hypothetical protein
MDARTGVSTRKVYTKYYDAGAWLVPKHLGMSVVVDHEKTRIPIAYGVQRSLGALGPSDSYANGKVTIYLWNFDDQPHAVKIHGVSSGRKAFTPTRQIINAIPQQKTAEVAGNFEIFNSGTSIPLKIDYELNGKRATIELKLARRTEEELLKYFGPNGNPPYPWYGGVSER